MKEETENSSWLFRHNWWKIGFFIVLFFFECAREIMVIDSNASARPNTTFNLFNFQEYTRVTGTWKRTDKGDAMSPAAISIECDRNKGTCIEAIATMNELYVFAPDISTYDAQFYTDNITFDDSSAECVALKYRIDLKLKRVDAIREKKENADKIALCKPMDDRIDLTLADSPLVLPDTSKHFVPVISAVKEIGKLF